MRVLRVSTSSKSGAKISEGFRGRKKRFFLFFWLCVFFLVYNFSLLRSRATYNFTCIAKCNIYFLYLYIAWLNLMFPLVLLNQDA